VPAQPILATKLYVTAPRPGNVARPRLTRQLDDALHRKLTLVSTPAGFGKTTLLAEWRASLAAQPSGTSGRRVAWLSLDENDDDGLRFWSHVTAAVETVCPGLGRTIWPVLRRMPPPALATVVDSLINALAAACCDGCALVLDDVHSLTSQAVYGSLNYFLEHLPDTVHLIMLTRADPALPLGRLRASGQMLELRAPDLRFTRDEVEAFFQQAAQPGLLPEEVAALEAHTEGWVAGLQLVAHSLRHLDAAQRGDFIRAFTGSHRHVLNYLTEEVLQHQPPEVQNFLLRSAILDRLNASVCNSVTGQARCQAMLEQFQRDNLFLLPLDAEGRWFRYHPLFAEALRGKLQQTQPDLWRECHGRAALWHEEHGFRLEAIRHALVAGELEIVAGWVENDYQPLIMQGAFDTLRSWLQVMPAELVERRPKLSLAAAWVLAYTGQQASIERHLRDAECAAHHAPARETAGLQSEIAALRAVFASVHGDTAAATEWASKALQQGARIDSFLNVVVKVALGNAYRLDGNMSRAAEAYAEVEAHGAQWSSPFVRLVPLVRMGQVRAACGQLREAHASFLRAIRLAAQQSGPGQLPCAEAHVRLADILREWNDLPAAEDRLSRGLRMADAAQHTTALLAGRLIEARLEAACGRPAAARQALAEAEALVSVHEFSCLEAQLGAQRARIDLELGDLSAAQRWAAAPSGSRTDMPAAQRELEALVRARVSLRSGDAATAAHQLSELVGPARAAGRMATVLECLVLQALAQQALGRLDQAAEWLSQALSLARPEGWVRLFVDEAKPMERALCACRSRLARDRADNDLAAYASRLLASFPGQQLLAVNRPTQHYEPLTPRELEILALVGRGASNHDVAEQLVLSVGTVKTHLNHILGKLGARNRTEAAAYARELGLLDF
jgi:LuxR family transcriptional regulator, maltose regulon positive regulatory protein